MKEEWSKANLHIGGHTLSLEVPNKEEEYWRTAEKCVQEVYQRLLHTHGAKASSSELLAMASLEFGVQALQAQENYQLLLKKLDEHLNQVEEKLT